MGSAVEEGDLSGRGLSSTKSKAFAKELPRLAAVKKLNFKENKRFRGDGWAARFSFTSATGETGDLWYCDLGATKAKAIARSCLASQLRRYSTLQVTRELKTRQLRGAAPVLTNLPQITQIPQIPVAALVKVFQSHRIRLGAIALELTQATSASRTRWMMEPQSWRPQVGSHITTLMNDVEVENILSVKHEQSRVHCLCPLARI